MSRVEPLVLQLQADAMDPGVSTSNLLRKAKTAATKLDLPEFLSWTDKELNGYRDVPVDDLPPYRKLTGHPRGYNQYHGWQPILFRSAEHQELFSRAPVGQAIGPIEQMLSKDVTKGGYVFPYQSNMKTELVNALDFPMDVHIELSYGQIWGIVAAVRNIILDWSLELEKSGILGEGLTFSENEKREAAPVSHQFFEQNIGVVGNIGDQAQVANVQSVHTQQLDYDKLAQLAQQIKTAAPLMPADKQDALIKGVAALEQELNTSTRNPSMIRRALASIKSICEDATGNVVAQGIISVIGSI